MKKIWRNLLLGMVVVSNLSACVITPPSVSVGFPPIFGRHHGHGGHHHFSSAPIYQENQRAWQR